MCNRNLEWKKHVIMENQIYIQGNINKRCMNVIYSLCNDISDRIKNKIVPYNALALLVRFLCLCKKKKSNVLKLGQ